MLDNKEDIINYIANKFPMIDNGDLEIIYLKCYNILINELYAGKKNELTDNMFKRYNTWLVDAMEEVITRNGINSALSYSENGISITFDGSYLTSLIKQIKPIVRLH